MAGSSPSCIFCQIAHNSTSTTLLHSLEPAIGGDFTSNQTVKSPSRPPNCIRWIPQDDKVVAFQDIRPAAFRHYLVIPVGHIPTVNDLQKGEEHYTLVSHMLSVGKTLLQRDAPQSKQYRFGFHQPPMNSVNHLHLHCLALPFRPRWKHVKYIGLGPLGFLEAEKLLEKIKPA